MFRKWLPRALCALISLLALVNLGIFVARRPENDTFINLASAAAWTIFPVVFGLVAALILSRQPDNSIGWLLMVTPLVLELALPAGNYLDGFTTAPEPTISILLMIWFQNWSWTLFIISLLMILLLFPTGRPPSPRWGWVRFYALGLLLAFILMTTFARDLQPGNGDWSVHNPIGFISNNDTFEAYVITPWLANLGLLAVLCAASLFFRYRLAGEVERAQIKWLLFSSGLFIVFYVPLILYRGDLQGLLGDVTNFLLIIFISLFPVAIAVAILRYRLWDIDVIIRRTLVYGLITALLALAYFGLVAVFQRLFSLISAEQSTVSIVLSTLIIAALFTPLHKRIQEMIDRRFYRQKFNAQKTLETFATLARHEVDLNQLSTHLVSTLQDTIQPESISLWLRSGETRNHE